MKNLNWKARDLKKLCAAQFILIILTITMSTFYYAIDIFGPQSRMFFSTGFEDFELYKNLQGSEIATVVFLWIFKALTILIGMLQMLVVNVDGQRTSIKNNYAIICGVLACLSFIVMVCFVSIIFQILLFNKYAEQIEEIEK